MVDDFLELSRSRCALFDCQVRFTSHIDRKKHQRHLLPGLSQLVGRRSGQGFDGFLGFTAFQRGGRTDYRQRVILRRRIFPGIACPNRPLGEQRPRKLAPSPTRCE